jgi:hypothetical protein
MPLSVEVISETAKYVSAKKAEKRSQFCYFPYF